MIRITSGILIYGGLALGLAAIAYIIIRDARGSGYSQKAMVIICTVALGMLLTGGALCCASFCNLSQFF